MGPESDKRFLRNSPFKRVSKKIGFWKGRYDHRYHHSFGSTYNDTALCEISFGPYMWCFKRSFVPSVILPVSAGTDFFCNRRREKPYGHLGNLGRYNFIDQRINDDLPYCMGFGGDCKSLL